MEASYQTAIEHGATLVTPLYDSGVHPWNHFHLPSSSTSLSPIPAYEDHGRQESSR